MSPKLGSLQTINDDKGYALVATLALGMLVSVLALAVIGSSLSLSYDSRALRQETELRALLEAGVNRALAAYARPNDELRSALVPDGRPVVWQFSGRTLTLSVEAESGKWDLNAAPLPQISALLRSLVPEQGAQSQIEQRISELRATGPIQSVASILDPLDRMSARQELFDRHFTVMTDQRGIDLGTAPLLAMQAYIGLPDEWKRKLLEARTEGSRRNLAELPASISGTLSQERPVYTFRAWTDASFGRAATLSSLVEFGDGGKIHIFSWRTSGKIP